MCVLILKDHEGLLLTSSVILQCCVRVCVCAQMHVQMHGHICNTSLICFLVMEALDAQLWVFFSTVYHLNNSSRSVFLFLVFSFTLIRPTESRFKISKIEAEDNMNMRVCVCLS